MTKSILIRPTNRQFSVALITPLCILGFHFSYTWKCIKADYRTVHYIAYRWAKLNGVEVLDLTKISDGN